MKKLLPLLLILAAPLAHAAPPAPTKTAISLPATAKLLFQVYGFSNFGGISSASSALQYASDNARQRMQARIEEGDGSHGPINVEYQCQSLYRVWGAPNVSQHESGSADGFFGSGGQVVYDASLAVNIYCDPRDFAQKVAISAMQACEKEPKVECMSKEYMDAFSKIEKTTYHDIYKK
ncbi:MAG: hypothetical protein JWP85_2760 [Rhodoglobus sp.]|nr:hypothetical protein [Rhodoglobus sp.]